MENDIFGGFSFLSNSLTGKGEKVDDIVEPSKITGNADDDVIIDDADLEDSETDDTEEDPTKSKTPSTEQNSTPNEDDIEEADLAELLQTSLFSELGWETDEDTKFKSVKEVVEYLSEKVTEASMPNYSSDEVAELDEYVRNGGSITDYLNHVQGLTSLDNIDMGNDNNLKSVIKENLKTKGYSDSRITKLIERYEDTGTLKDEAEDAIELLKEHREKEKETLLETQRKEHELAKRKQLDFAKGVETTIESVNTIRGIELNKAEKAKLKEYIFKPTSEGRTQYQIDYAKDLRNLVESAYFTMKGDKLVDKVKTQANSDAAKRLKEKLAEKGKRVKNQTNQNDGGSLWETASGFLRKPL